MASCRGREGLDRARFGGAQNSEGAPPGKQKLFLSDFWLDQSVPPSFAFKALRSAKGSGSSPAVTGSKATPGLRG